MNLLISNNAHNIQRFRIRYYFTRHLSKLTLICLIFQDDNERKGLRGYWKQLSCVGGGCLSMFIFDMCERGIQLRNPFYSIWANEIGTQIAVNYSLLIVLLETQFLQLSILISFIAELCYYCRNRCWSLLSFLVIHYLSCFPQYQR